VRGFGSVGFWKDGREVADTVQAVFEYPEGVRLAYAATLANSFEAEADLYYGSDAAVMIRGMPPGCSKRRTRRCWLEVYAARTPSTGKPASRSAWTPRSSNRKATRRRSKPRRGPAHLFRAAELPAQRRRSRRRGGGLHGHYPDGDAAALAKHLTENIKLLAAPTIWTATVPRPRHQSERGDRQGAETALNKECLNWPDRQAVE